MRKLRKAFALCLVLIMVFALAACGGGGSSSGASGSGAAGGASQSASQPAAGGGEGGEGGGKIAVVFATGGLGDKTYNDTLYYGVQAICEERGLSFDYAEPMDSAEYEPLLRGYADSGEYLTIVSLGYSQATSLEQVAPNYPDQKFTLIDAQVEIGNVACYSWREHELGYLVGVMNAMLTESNILGYIAAHDVYNCNMGLSGMMTGAKAVNPDIEVVYGYNGSWDDVAGAKELTVALHEKGADIFYHNAANGGLGMLEAAVENDFYCVAFDGNLNADAPNNCIASGIRHLAVAVSTSLDKIADGTFKGEIVSLGAAENALEVNFEGSNITVPDDVKQAINEAFEGIASGDIYVPDTLEAYEAMSA